MPIAAFISVCLVCAQPPTVVRNKSGEVVGKLLGPAEPLKPDKFGFMTWMWVERSSNRLERARAKFISENKGVVTIKTDRGQTVKIPMENLSAPQRQWLDAERRKQEEAKEKKTNAKP